MNTEPKTLLNNKSTEYSKWLTKQIGDSTYKNKSYSILFKILFNIYFTPILELDKNRTSDIVSLLREPYINTINRKQLFTDKDVNSFLSETPRFLELIISLGMRIDSDFLREINGVDNSRIYFWMILKNLELLQYDDDSFKEENVLKIIDILTKVNTRTYTFNGKGGLFPLEYTEIDQRNVQIWDQMCTFVNQKFYKI